MSDPPILRTSRTGTHALEHGRDAFRKQAWGKAFSHFCAADRKSSLVPEDLANFAQTALLTGRETEGVDLLARAHRGFLNGGDTQRAARCAFWLGFTLLIQGEFAKAGGWLSRAGRLLEGQPDCVDKGYLLLPEAYRLYQAGDAIAAHARFLQARDCGERFGDKDLVTLALQGQGRSLIRQGEIARGVALLDEAMVAVTSGEVSPLNAGGVYCSVLDACGEIFDIQRAQEWTSALEKWCASQPDLVPYRGHCLVRRVELLQLHGAWSEALECAERACELLSHPTPKATIGAAYYQIAEIQRMLGRFADSHESYRRASEWSKTPAAGPAQLRLAQGEIESANVAIRRIAEEVREAGPRARVLDAYVEIVLAVQDIDAARAAADELSTIAARWDVPFLRALACRANGAVLLADGSANASLVELRQSWSLWCELDAPYEASRVRVLIAQACREVKDEENARLELTAACQTFERLGAITDLSRVRALLSGNRIQKPGPLTEREVQVLRLVASGITNRAVARKLNITEKTVARHLSNIFTKLDLKSRTAAAAYAFDHDLV